MMTEKRVPRGFLIANIPLESCKAFPIQIWKGLSVKPRVAYSDQKNGEATSLCIKLIEGAKTAPHPQLNFYVKGNYHIEELQYYKSNFWNWQTWIEFEINTNELDHILASLQKAKTACKKHSQFS
ncbi:MAG: hypothetical protein ACQXXG_09005 [Candidatus Bathyarchaeia archaeon]|jgi:hypothetical protein